MEINKIIPVMFQKIDNSEVTVEDTRFMKVKIWLMHTDENYNGSFFEKKVVEEAIWSLANTPILVYIEDNSDGDIYFSDHRQVLVVEKNNVKIKYLGQSIGTIPETNNAHFEMRLCDDGIEREFLVVDGLIWEKWDEPIDIMNRDVIKQHSMEIHDDYTGSFGEDNLYHFSSFKFFGACGLGKDVSPAMANSTIEKQFSYNELYKETQDKMEQYKQFILNQSLNSVDDKEKFKKEDEKLDEKLKLLEKYSVTQEAFNIDLEKFSLEEIETKLVEFTSTPEPETPVQEDFSLSSNQLEQEIRNVLNTRTSVVTDRWGDTYERVEFYYRDIKDEYVIVIDNQWENCFGIPFTMSGDVPTLDFDNKVAFVPDWRPKVEGDSFSGFSTEISEEFEYSINKATEKASSEKETEFSKKIAELQDELNVLSEFKTSKIAQEREEAETILKEQFSTELDASEIEEIFTAKDACSVKELEMLCYAKVGQKKAKFSAIKKFPDVKVPVAFTKQENVLGWENLVEKHRGK